MTRRFSTELLALGMVAWGILVGSVTTAGAQETPAPCTNATLLGTYGAQMQGTRPVPPAGGGGIESVIGVVIRTYDGQGTFTQIDNVKGSVTGIVPDRPGSGTYEVSADCLVTATFQPGPGITIVERMVILEGGAEVRSITTSPLSVMVTAVSRRIAAGPPPVPAVPCPGPDPFASIPTLIGECVNGGWVPRVRGGTEQ